MTNDGRIIIGDLKGYDQYLNIILNECTERIFDSNIGMTEIILGLYIIRGDNLSTIGELDIDIDKSTNWDNIHAEPLKSTIV